MAEKFLGPSFDIHLGGLDLVFPHHENERAQSQAAGREFARIWMHNGLLQLDREKMSKSVGNIARLNDVLSRWGRETVLLYFMTGQWSKPIDFSDEVMEQAEARVERFREVFRGPSRPGGDWGSFAAALEDDFNTPEALAVLHGWPDHDLLRRALAVFGLEGLAQGEDAPPDTVELAEPRPQAPHARALDQADPLPAEIESA